ncbi:hypothetical protein PR202_gb29172 [Eleusine coracana subsp. coracana]|uniref:Retrotransposon gag domain-containing protein n=1 Tax=Eleusine coracana subsp. coracana TaxID=191504 RepID=A0AAV5FYR4_ELECO|nr:hypothetical protein PR202_gb29172 [Eleusine coracana subsp. coracana]
MGAPRGLPNPGPLCFIDDSVELRRSPVVLSDPFVLPLGLQVELTPSSNLSVLPPLDADVPLVSTSPPEPRQRVHRVMLYARVSTKPSFGEHIARRMVTTCRGEPESSQQGAQNDDLPAPPPNLWAQVMSMMFESTQEDTELLRKIAQLLNRNGGCHDDQPRQSTYQNFLSTHPPTFEHAREPLDADNFIRIIESIFGLLQWTNAQKPLFAAQQLLGSAVVWWAYYMASLPEGHIVLWEEFKYAFRSHFIPAGIMERKLQEFLDLKQGGRTVLEYSQKFNHLAQYAFLSCGFGS